jgi:translocation and assembly module TamB
MADNELETKLGDDPAPDGEPLVVRRSWLSRRNLLLSLGVSAIVVLLAGLLTIGLYRAGVFDTYIKGQFVTKLADIGIVFDAETFRVTASPMTLEMHNATFKDKVTGDPLFSVRDAHLGLTVLDLLAWRTSRDIQINTSDINGAEVWIKFDENGLSNFSNLKFAEDENGSRVNFRYESVNFQLHDSTIHFGDLSRRLSADARNLTFLLSPQALPIGDDARYNFELSATDSNFQYDDRVLQGIDVRAQGVADNKGADISSLTLHTPVGDSTLSGNMRDWKNPAYDLDITSTIDITQVSSIFDTGTALRGVGNFKGHVSGVGETYHIQGTADSEALRAAGVYLKAVNVEGTVEGTNTNYTANGTAVAELLTFGDFQIDFPKMAGNVRGTGTDFRWVGELQAAAAKSPGVTLGGLFLSDAIAEYKDRELRTSVGNARAQRFAVGDTVFEGLQARNLGLENSNGVTTITSPNASAKTLAGKDFRLNGVAGRNLKVKDTANDTTVNVDSATSESAKIGNNNVRGVTARQLKLKTEHGTTDLSALDLKARDVDANGTRIEGLESPEATLRDTPGETLFYADKLRVAKIDTGAAVLGSLNIGGVRLTIRRGTIEGTTGDIDAGNIALKRTNANPNGGSLEAVKIVKPVFVVEPSGRYRASADMSIGGGTVGSISLGAATAKVDINNDRALLNDLNAKVMNGDVNGTIAVALNNRELSRIDADFTDLDLSKLAAMQSGRIMPLEGKTTGSAHLTFPGTNYRTTSGSLNITVAANAGTVDSGLVPVNGKIDLTADRGLFTVTQARLFTDNSQLTATGRFDLRDNNSDLTLALNSKDASEIKRIVDVTGVSPALSQEMASLQLELAGALNFNGSITGNLYDPVVNGKAAVDSVLFHGQVLGKVSTDVAVSPTGRELNNGMLAQPDGGSADFAVNMPYGTPNSTTVNATLNGVNAGSLLAVLPIDLPGRLRDLDGKTSGTVKISGLPNKAEGNVNLTAVNGTIAGQTFDELKAAAAFHGTRIELETAAMRFGTGSLTASGFYDRSSAEFNFDLNGSAIPTPLVLAFLPADPNIPAINGIVDLTANAKGRTDRPEGFDVSFNGVSHQTTLGATALGDVTFNGKTEDQRLTAELVATLEGRAQRVSGDVRFGDPSMPFSVSTTLDQSPLGPFITLIQQLKDMPITGTGTGQVALIGNLRDRDSKGEYIFSPNAVAGTAKFSQLALNIQDTPLTAIEPVSIHFNSREIVFDDAKFGGGGSNMAIVGTKALGDEAENNLEINGRISLNLLNLANTDIFFAGLADVSMRLYGPNKTARLSGVATTENATIATFIGSDRLTFDHVKTRVIFTTDQAEIEEAKGFLGGGKFSASGGVLLSGLNVRAFRFSVDGENVTVPLPKDFLTTGDAQLEISALRPTPTANLQTTIAGRVTARKSLYTKDIELANVIGGRRETSLSSGSSSLTAPRYDLVIEGRNALVVRNNIADLTASVSLSLTGDADNPSITGRITANSGTLFYRKDRYEIQRATLEFPPDTAIDPIINLQAETEIAGYQIFVNLAGPLTDTDRLVADVRSSPALPSNDVVSLITTGSLSDSAGGIPSLARTGINTAAEVITDSIINNPIRKATDKLFGLNVFEIDPIISGEQLNPSARLTVGRQINNNLKVTYSTNLSQDQNQIIAFEYRVSNKLSVVAQYEQRSITNVTRNREVFSIEVRFRKRF